MQAIKWVFLVETAPILFAFCHKVFLGDVWQFRDFHRISSRNGNLASIGRGAPLKKVALPAVKTSTLRHYGFSCQE